MKPQVIAFYLPQFHPIKENDEWFGKGFTEWTNVAKAKPLFKTHRQPKIPQDLGFYDLRLPEVRFAQAELAKEAGISAFCYYHYWFGNGKVLLEKPLQEVIKLGTPDLPFCLCWANHSWYKKSWNPDVKRLDQKMLLEQLYPGDEDIIEHFNFLKSAFKDPRYYKVEGKLLFVIYDFEGFIGFNRFKEIWSDLAEKNGLPGFYFLAYTSRVSDVNDKNLNQWDGLILSLVTNFQYNQNFSIINRCKIRIRKTLAELFNYPQFVYQYKDVIPKLLNPVCSNEKIIPTIVPNWDYTPRRGVGGLIFKDSNPDLFACHVRQAFDLIKNKKNKLVFLKSWNEWGEGNYMEPDIQYGKGYIEALGAVVKSFSALK